MTTSEILTGARDVLNYPLFKLGDTTVNLAGILTLALLLVAVFQGERLFRKQVMARALRRTHMDAPLQYAVSRISGYLFIAFGCYLALQIVGINLTSLAFLAGAVGVGLGFGLQNVVSNFISGLIILAERPIAIGDRIQMGDVTGRVARMSLRSTTIVTNDNISIIVPNSDFITNPVTNWSHGDPKVQFRLPIGVAYGSDLDKMQRVLLKAARENPHVLQQPEPCVYFVGFGDSSLDFELGVWTAEMVHAPRRFRSHLFFAVERELRNAGIEIPFPQRDLHLRSGRLNGLSIAG